MSESGQPEDPRVTRLLGRPPRFVPKRRPLEAVQQPIEEVLGVLPDGLPELLTLAVEVRRLAERSVFSPFRACGMVGVRVERFRSQHPGRLHTLGLIELKGEVRLYRDQSAE